jgi:adenine-specific DNA-methyltransferase
LGVFNPAGHRVGQPGPERNTEYLLVSAPEDVLAAIT